MDLFRGIGRKINLVLLENRDYAGIEFLVEVHLDVTHGQDDPCPRSPVLFIEAEEGIEGIVENLIREEIVGIIKTDDEHDLPLDDCPADVVQDLPERDTGRGRQVTKEFQVDPREDRKAGPLVLAVDIDGHKFPCGLLHLGKDPVDAGSLAGAWEATEDGVHRPGTLETGTKRKGQLAELWLPVFELVGEMIDLEDITVPEKCLVRHEVFHEEIHSGPELYRAHPRWVKVEIQAL